MMFYMTFGSINRSEIEMKPSAQGVLVENYQKRNRKRV